MVAPDEIFHSRRIAARRRWQPEVSGHFLRRHPGDVVTVGGAFGPAAGRQQQECDLPLLIQVAERNLPSQPIDTPAQRSCSGLVRGQLHHRGRHGPGQAPGSGVPERKPIEELVTERLDCHPIGHRRGNRRLRERQRWLAGHHQPPGFGKHTKMAAAGPDWAR